MADDDRKNEFCALVDSLYQSQADLAREIETTPQTINNYYRGRKGVPKSLIRYLQAQKEIARLKSRLEASDKLADAWTAWLAQHDGQ